MTRNQWIAPQSGAGLYRRSTDDAIQRINAFVQFGPAPRVIATLQPLGAPKQAFPSSLSSPGTVEHVTVTRPLLIAHHADYVRSVKITPTGPETMELTAEWLFHPDTLARPDFDVDKITRFGIMVMEQDGGACELNHAGMRASAFHHGVLMQEEYEVYAFQRWVRSRLDASVEPLGTRASRRKA